VPGVPSGWREELTGWSARAWRVEAGRIVRDVERSGTTPAEWWGELDRCLRRGVLTWVFSDDAYRDMTLLGLWTELEAGRIYLWGNDERDKADRDSGTVSEVPERQTCAEPVGRRGADGGLFRLRGELPSGPEDARAEGKRVRRRGMGFVVVNDPPTIVQFRRRGRCGPCKWVDTRNYGFAPVPEVSGQDVGLSATVRFVRRMCDTLSSERLGALQNTASGQAWYAWRRKHLTHPPLVHCHGPALRLERSAYLGGRCECFVIGKVPPPVYHLDVRSMYASCYTGALLPVRLRHFIEGALLLSEHLEPVAEQAITEVTIESDTPDYPCVRPLVNGKRVRALSRGEPIPQKRAGAICIYPVGRFRTCLCGPELVHALQRGRVREAHRVAVYDMASALTALGTHLGRMRDEFDAAGEKAMALWTKSMLVGLVGRLGMHGRRWVPAPGQQSRGVYRSWVTPGPDGVPTRWRSIAWDVQEEQVSAEGAESVPAMAAWITSLARIKLLEGFDAANCGRVYYCDTDSLWCDQNGYQGVWASGILGSGEPGLFRLVRVHQDAEFIGYKHYRADERIVCAGVPLTYGVSEGLRGGYEVREGAGGALNGCCTPEVRGVVRSMARRQPYLHGNVRADGVVEPIRLWED
jgi:hypothetical protein